MDNKLEPKTAKMLQQDIANLSSGDEYIIVLSKLNGDKIESWAASNNFRTNDYPIVRNYISQMIYEMHEAEVKKSTATTQESKIKDQEYDLKNLLENM